MMQQIGNNQYHRAPCRIQRLSSCLLKAASEIAEHCYSSSLIQWLMNESYMCIVLLRRDSRLNSTNQIDTVTVSVFLV